MASLIPDVSGLGSRDLLRLYAQILSELRRRTVVRSANAPAGDLAERLVRDAYLGVLAPPSVKSWDVELADGTRLQVKSRVVDSNNKKSQTFSPFRSWDFDSCIFVLFDATTYDVSLAVSIERDAARAMARRSEWVAGERLTVRQILAAETAVDVTERLRAAYANL